MKKGILALWVILVFLIAFLMWKFVGRGNEVLDPINQTNPSKSPFDLKVDSKIVGFLPSFMVGKTIIYSNEVDDLIFLGVEVDEKGNLIWDSQARKVDSQSYFKQKESIKKAGGKNILGIKLFDDEKLNKLMASEEAKKNLIEQIKLSVRSKNFDGVNLDFEYQDSPTTIAGDDFYSFLTALKNENLGEISVDVFANTILRSDMGNLKRLVDESDYLIVMAYDFHRSGSTNAGPVAPIRAPIGERNISEVALRVDELKLNKNKIILAYPLYGYEWVTETMEFGSLTKENGVALASYKRMVEMLSKPEFLISNFKLNHDDISQTPWLSYEENGKIHQIYYENLESISAKVKLVIDNKLGGVGFWALGYEGENRDIWEGLGLLYN
ncbi:MAG: glycosyl hydrolase family 18 protein [Candidatus Shapirobacteria bacterium]